MYSSEANDQLVLNSGAPPTAARPTPGLPAMLPLTRTRRPSPARPCSVCAGHRAIPCPVDRSSVVGTSMLRLRSISLSHYMHGEDFKPNFGADPLLKSTQIRHPSNTLTFIEEAAMSIDDGVFLYSSKFDEWLNIPARRHQNGSVLAFADEHAEYWKWKGPTPALVILMAVTSVTRWSFRISSVSSGPPRMSNSRSVANIMKKPNTY